MPLFFSSASYYSLLLLKLLGFKTYFHHTAPAVLPLTCVSNGVISLHLCMPGWISCLPFFLASTRCSFQFWFNFASESFHGCHYKLCFLLEQRYWKIFHYIYLWIIFQSIWCQSPFQPPSSASPSCLAVFSLTFMTPLLNLCCYNLNPAYLKNFVTSLAAHMKENVSLYMPQWRDKPKW